MPINKNSQLVANVLDLKTTTQIHKKTFLLAGFFWASVFAIFVIFCGQSFFFVFVPLFNPLRLLDGMQHWFFGDLVRSCPGLFCIEFTTMGQIVIGIAWFFSGFLSAIVVWLISHKISQVLRNTRVFVLVGIGTVTMYAALTILLSLLQPYIPHLPLSFRCSSVLNVYENNLTLDLSDSLIGKRSQCVMEIAAERESIEWCRPLREDGVVYGICVDAVARKLNDVNICDGITDNQNEKSRCRDSVLYNNKITNSSNTGTASSSVDYSTLIGFSAADVGRSNFYSTGNIARQPHVAWTQPYNQSNLSGYLSPVVAGDFILFSSTRSDNGQGGAVLFENSTGKETWTMKRPQYYYGSFNITPSLVHGVIIYSDYDYIYAYSIQENKELWKKKISSVRTSPVADKDIIYFVGDYGGSTGDSVTFYALDLSTGHQKWSTVFGENLYMDEKIVLTDTSLIILGRKVYSTDSIIYIFDKTNGKLQYTLEQKGVNYRGAPLYGDQQLFVRTDKKILSINPLQGKITKEFDVLPSKSSSVQMAYSDNTLYLVNQDGAVIALDTTQHRTLWKLSIEGDIIKGPIVTPSYVYFATKTTMFAANRSNGTIIWQFALEDTVDSNIVAANQSICFTTKSGRMYVLK